MSDYKLKQLRKETIKKLNELKDNLSYDNMTNYTDMINTLIDYDNNAQDNLYLYDNILQYYNFVDDELISYIIEDDKKRYGYYDLDRLRCFINDTRSDDIYILDGYGNLENIDDGVIIDCINQSIETLEENI